MLSLLLLSLKAIFPVFGWILLGTLLYRNVPVTQRLFSRGEQLIFYLGLPGLLFATATKIDIEQVSSSTYTLAGVIATLACLTVGILMARWRGHSQGDIGVISQASFRANLAIIGLALCASTFGEEGLVLAAMPVALWTLLFNILAVVVLNSAYGGRFALLPVALALLKNPLIIGICLGLFVALSGAVLPPDFYQGSKIYSKIVIPLSLIFLGGAIELRPARQSRQAIVLASLLRLLIAPLIATAICLLMGLRGAELGVNFLLLSGPVAVASHIMVAAKGGNARLAANIVVITTALAPFTITLGLFLLKLLNLV